MRALASIGTFILALVVVTVMLTAVSMLAALDSPTADLRIEDIESGNLVPMLVGNTLWSSYPGFPVNGSALIDYYAIAFASVVASACVVLHRSSLKCPPLFLAVGSMAAGCIPYTIGAVVLRTTAHTPYESGVLVSLMILGVAYCACVSLVCSCLDLATPILVAWRDRRLQANEQSVALGAAGRDGF